MTAKAIKRSLIFRRAAFLFALSSACGPTAGAFRPLDRGGGQAVLTGHVVADDGLPRTRVRAHIVAGGHSIARAETGADGVFRVTSPMTGAIQLVLNDGQGNGKVRAMTLYAGGTNDAGTLILEPLLNFPEVVELHGVGFEERLTSVEGGLRGCLVTSARYRPRRMSAGPDFGGGEEGKFYNCRAGAKPGLVSVSQISLEDGSETPVRDLPIGKTLIDDWLFVQETKLPRPSGRGPDYYELIFSHAETGRELHRLRSGSLRETQIFYAGTALVLLQQEPVDQTWDMNYRPVRFERDGSVRTGPLLQGGPMRGIRSIDRDGGIFYRTSAASSTTGVQLYALDFSSLESSTAVRLPDADDADVVEVEDQKLLLQLVIRRDTGGTRTSIAEVDLRSGDRRVLYSAVYSDADAPTILISNHQRVGATIYGEGALIGGFATGFIVFDTVTRATRLLSLDVTIGGRRFHACGGPPNSQCLAEVRASGTSVIEDHVEVDGKKYRLVITQPPDGPASGRLFPGAGNSLFWLEPSMSGRHEVWLDEMFEARWGDAGADPASFVQLTFIPTSWRFVPSADEKYLSHVAPDPISGLTQLFRVSTEPRTP